MLSLLLVLTASLLPLLERRREASPINNDVLPNGTPLYRRIAIGSATTRI